MALFKRFFYRKPPDGLLEISDRVFVFDCCFTADIMDDDEYKKYLGGIVTQLQEYYTDASFMAFNFREGNKQSHLASILSKYDMTVMDYPRQYETCPLLTMEMVHHFLRSCESWILLGQRNVLLMHCERGGWPILAFMLAALLIYRKQYTGEQKTLEMIYKQAPRELLQLMSPVDPSPSQLRYLQYISRRNLGSEWPPLDRALTMDCIILRFIPNMDGEGGCRPIFRIYGPDPLMVADPTPKVLFSTPKRSKVVRQYKQADCQLVKIDINCHVQGDVVLECISLDSDLERERLMFRIMFNTAFIRSNILMLNLDEVDLSWNDKDCFPKDFRAEVIFSEMDSRSSPVMLHVPDIDGDGGLPVEAFAKVKEIFSSVDWVDTSKDVALNVLQKITSANLLQEKLDSSLLKGTADNQFNIFSRINSCDSLWDDQNLAEDAEKPSPKVLEDDITSSSPDLNLAFKKSESRGLHIITQRILQTSLSSPTVHSSSQQASPMSLSRYHSAPFLGITALLHDHDEPKAKEVYLSAKTSPVASGSSSPEMSTPVHFSVISNLESSRSPFSLLPSEATTIRNDKTELNSPPAVSELDLCPSSIKSSSDMDTSSSLSISSLTPLVETATLSKFSATAPQPPHRPDITPDPEPLHTSVIQHSGTSVLGRVRSSSVPPHPPPSSVSEKSSITSSKSLSSLATIAQPSADSSATRRNLMRPPAPIPTSKVVLSQSKDDLSPSPPSPPLPPVSLHVDSQSTDNLSPIPPSPPLPPVSHHVNSSDSSPLPVKRLEDIACPRPPPLPPLSSKPAGPIMSTAPLPPPAPSFASKGPPNKISLDVPLAPVPPPPSTTANGLLKAGTTPVPPAPVPPPPSPTANGLLKASTAPVPPAPVPPPPSPTGNGPGGTASSNGNIPPIPGPLLNAKGRLNLRPGSKNQVQSSKKSNLKPYHWLKLTRAMQGSLWAETQKSDEASKAAEFDMSELESLFSVVPNSDTGSRGKSNRRASAAKPEKVSLIDFRRAYNCEIMLSKVKIPLPDMMNAVLALDDSALDIDQVENLIKFCPTKEEMEVLKNYRGDKENLGKCEQFFLELMKVPRVEAKLRVFAFKIQFCSQVSDLRKSLNAVNSTSEEVRNSMKLKRIMQTILSLGNALNQGTARGSAVGFRLDSLLKLTDTRARNNKLTLMHYLCKVLAEKLPELLDFHKDLVTLEISTKLKYLAEEMQAISKGLEKIVQELTASEGDGPVSETFCQILKEFLGFAEAEVRSLASLYSVVGKNADALALYFGEDPARCPFEQVVSTLRNFVRMFVRAHEENCKQIELEKKKSQKEEEKEKEKSSTLRKRPEMETMKTKECAEHLIKT
ncbi:formin-like protein 18 isoform X2 [Daucus carota subsp. sativus]|uniref:formin-like protein 18 isoform X2 n=1 Tax=Daucus carota subsp. sativus TaxID=79200 RepID=UPI0007EF0FE7|nr:PREDICTED: formin-like protein 18 isoform X2 [Daucus carota subsp. sativus]